MRDKSQIKSAATIASMLHTGGYTARVHNSVKRYWKHCLANGNGKRNLRRLEREFSDFMQDATEAERLLVGKFIAYQARMNFDTGLRIGIQAFAHNGNSVPDWATDDNGQEEIIES